MAVRNKELRGIDLTVARGERIVIAGPSGSGKSTLIRCINRLETHQQGRIEVDGIELNSSMKNIGQLRAEVGMCFQQFNLFPHMTILENCTLAPMSLRGLSRSEADKIAPKAFFGAPQHERTRMFLDQVLGH
ncbi:amino acid ABC transporter ATP-binding protein (plasmid) [Paracoccus seriniphilus]|nr:amino acid ABC transporter ATP-binding protein [Paracoccus seriniphilus]